MIIFCKNYIWKYKKILILYLGISAVSTIIMLTIPMLFGYMVDIITIERDINTLIKIGIVVLGLGLINVLIEYWNNRFYVTIQTNSAIDMSMDVIQHLRKVSLLELGKYDPGYLNESINHDSNSIIIFFLSLVIQVFSNGLILILSLLVLCYISIELVVLILFLICTYMLIYLSFRSKIRERARIFKEAQSVFFGALLKQFTDFKFIRQHSLEKVYKSHLRKAFEEFFVKALNSQQFFFMYSSMNNVMENIANVCIYILGGINIIKGNITIGAFTIILNYYGNILSTIKYFANFGKEYQDNHVAYERLKRNLELEEQRNGEQFLESVFEISCKNLKFLRNNERIIQDFNYTFEKGRIYCVQGENGSGKTTLLDLIVGMFIGEYEGQICYNHINIEEIDMRRMRLQKISVLEQFPPMIDGDLEENIHLTKFHYDNRYQNKIIKKEMKGICNGGKGISGGEKQKIGILRALAMDGEVLVLDEPTSALDHEGRDELFDILKEIKKEKIIILVSHDVETCQIADHIICVDCENKKGNVV